MSDALRTPDVAGGVVRALAACRKAEARLPHRRRRGAAAARRSDFYRVVWQEAAAGVGATITYLDGMLAEIECGPLVLRVRGNVTSLDDPVTLSVAGNKPLVDRLLSEHGLPVPRGTACRYDDSGAARRFVATIDGPCVVKPARSTGGGMGITTGVRSSAQLLVAMARAGSLCSDVVIEEQLSGANYRLLYLDGELLDAVERRPPTVCGDGVSTIGQLLRSENDRRAGGGFEVSQGLVAVDHELRQTLKASRRRLDSIPARGEQVVVKTVVSDGRREDNVHVSDSLCEAVVRAGAAAAAALGVRLAGVDVITPDPALPLSEAGGAIIEVNTTPGLYYHYMTADAAVPVALLILRRLCGPSS